MNTISKRERVIYLFGAGASHASAKSVNSAYGILMTDLRQELADRLHTIVETNTDFKGKGSLQTLVNDVLSDEHVDFEHAITFLDESPSQLHKQFAAAMRESFEEVLRHRLSQIQTDLGGTPDRLYAALLDMYEVPGLPEELGGCLTINYDSYLEHAIARFPHLGLDVGIHIHQTSAPKVGIRLLKLHGSFDWEDAWPVARKGGETLWIPPGIQKGKERYPFNVLWGLARELLDCDVLRIVGCRLGANDWDLISLLFATLHTSAHKGPYRIEIIDAPTQARRLQRDFPYLGVLSLLEIEPIGSQLIAEVTGGPPRTFATLTDSEQIAVLEKASDNRNWFLLWLKHKAEITFKDIGSVTTKLGAFETLLKAY